MTELIVAMGMVALLALFLHCAIPHCTGSGAHARAGKAGTLVRMIEAGCEQYEKVWNVYPPGDGADTTPGPQHVYVRLTAPGPSGLPYLQKNQDNRRYFVNPVDGSEIIKYRTNAVAVVPNTALQPIRNPNRVDIWCGTYDELRGDDKVWQIGQNDGINNWR